MRCSKQAQAYRMQWIRRANEELENNKEMHNKDATDNMDINALEVRRSPEQSVHTATRAAAKEEAPGAAQNLGQSEIERVDPKQPLKSILKQLDRLAPIPENNADLPAGLVCATRTAHVKKPGGPKGRQGAKK